MEHSQEQNKASGNNRACPPKDVHEACTKHLINVRDRPSNTISKWSARVLGRKAGNMPEITSVSKDVHNWWQGHFLLPQPPAATQNKPTGTPSRSCSQRVNEVGTEDDRTRAVRNLDRSSSHWPCSKAGPSVTKSFEVSVLFVLPCFHWWIFIPPSPPAAFRHYNVRTALLLWDKSCSLLHLCSSAYLFLTQLNNTCFLVQVSFPVIIELKQFSVQSQKHQPKKWQKDTTRSKRGGPVR